MARYLKPAVGLVIPSKDHAGAPLPNDGAWVEDSTYWSRRLADQEVTDDTKAQIAREAAEAKAVKKDAAPKKDTDQ